MKIEVERVIKGGDYIKATMEWRTEELPEVDPEIITASLIRGLNSFKDDPSKGQPMSFKVSPAMLDKLSGILKEADESGYQWDV